MLLPVLPVSPLTQVMTDLTYLLQGQAVVSPEQYGALGGSTNDTTAVQAALSALQAAGGGALLCRQFYRCTSPLTYTGSNLSIIAPAAGGGITVDHTGNAFVIGTTRASGAQSTNIRFVGLTIQQNAANTAGAAVRVLNTQGLQFVGVRFVGPLNSLSLGDTAASAPNDVVDVVVDNCFLSTAPYANSSAVLLINGANFTCANSKFNGSNQSGVPAIVFGSSGYNWDGFKMANCLGEQWDTVIQATTSAGGNGQMIGCDWDRIKVKFIDARPTTGNFFRHWAFADNRISGASGAASIGYYMTDENGGSVYDVAICSGEVYSFGHQGLWADGSAHSLVSKIVVTGVMFEDCGLSTSNTYDSLRLQSVDGPVVSGCSIRGTSQRYGIYIPSTTNIRTSGSAFASDVAALESLNLIVGAATAPAST